MILRWSHTLKIIMPSLFVYKVSEMLILLRFSPYHSYDPLLLTYVLCSQLHDVELSQVMSYSRLHENKTETESKYFP